MSNLAGMYLGRYHILELLGRGGMAAVYKAFDTQLERTVAIKVLLQNEEDSSQFLIRFKREAQTLAKLSHPNIVKVLDYGEQDGFPYLVMDYVPNGNLANRAERPMHWCRAAEVLLPIARALNYAHIHGVIHRDVKPANILLTESGVPMLSDFGIAKLLQPEETLELTGAGKSIGTPEYMAPEQSSGEEVDYRADIYALGVVFYELVTGERPYTADTPLAVIMKQHSQPLPSPRQYVPEIPVDIELFILKLLAKDPDQRYPNMLEVAIGLENIVQGATLNIIEMPDWDESATKVGWWNLNLPAWPASQNRKLIAVLLIAAFGILAFFLLRSLQEPKIIAITGGSGSAPGVEFASMSGVSGLVEILSADGETVPVENGMKLVVGGPFRVRSQEGQARMILSDGSVICIHPATEVEFFKVNSIKPGLPEFSLNLVSGRLLFVDTGEHESLFSVVNPLPVTIASYGAIIGLEKNEANDLRLDFDCLDGVCTFESLSNRLNLLVAGHIWLESAGLFSSINLPRMEVWAEVCSDLAVQRVSGMPTPTQGGLLGALSRLVNPGAPSSPSLQPTISGLSITVTPSQTRTLWWPFGNLLPRPTETPQPEGRDNPSPVTSSPSVPTPTSIFPVDPATATPRPSVPTRTARPTDEPTIVIPSPSSPPPTETQTSEPYPPPVEETPIETPNGITPVVTEPATIEPTVLPTTAEPPTPAPSDTSIPTVAPTAEPSSTPEPPTAAPQTVEPPTLGPSATELPTPAPTTAEPPVEKQSTPEPTLTEPPPASVPSENAPSETAPPPPGEGQVQLIR